MIVTCSWIFNVFDEDGGGTIDKEEVTSAVTNDYFIVPCFLFDCQVSKLVGSLLKLTGGQQQQQQEGDEASLQSCVQVSPAQQQAAGQEVTILCPGDTGGYGRGRKRNHLQRGVCQQCSQN